MSISSLTPTVCTVSGNTVTAIAAGTCTIAADQVGDTNFNATPQVTQNIVIPVPVFNYLRMDFRDGVASVGSISDGGSTYSPGGWKWLSDYDVNVTSSATALKIYISAHASGISNYSTQDDNNYIDFVMPSNFPPGTYYLFAFGSTYVANSLAVRVNDGAIVRQTAKIFGSWTSALGPFAMGPGDHIRFSRTNTSGGVSLRTLCVKRDTSIPSFTPSGQSGTVIAFI
ncbi:hypothetical protein CCP3SC15_530023 [Gammaproteobacteria bacterium]